MCGTGIYNDDDTETALKVCESNDHARQNAAVMRDAVLASLEQVVDTPRAHKHPFDNHCRSEKEADVLALLKAPKRLYDPNALSKVTYDTAPKDVAPFYAVPAIVAISYANDKANSGSQYRKIEKPDGVVKEAHYIHG